jgi:hypothetical protein
VPDAEAAAGECVLDVNVDEFARTRSLVADRLLKPDPAELAHPDPGQHP